MTAMLRLSALSAIATALACLVFASPSWAHAELVYAAPGNGQTLQYAPERVRLQFSEPVSLAGDGVRVLTASGETLPVGTPTQPPDDLTTVDVALPETLADGGYAVAWRVVSADGHPVSGALSFNVGMPGTAPAAAARVDESSSDGAATAYGVARWFGFAALGLLVGTAFFLAYAWPAGAALRGARRLLWFGWAASVAAAVVSGVLYGPYLAGTAIGTALDGKLIAGAAESRLGAALGVRLALLAALVPAILFGLRWLAKSSAPHRFGGAAVLGVGVMLAITWGIAGHSNSGTLPVAALVSDVVHLNAMAVWLGGLAVLAFVLLPSRDVAGMRAAVPAFSRAAAFSIAALVATGLFQAWRQVRTVPALLGTPYGRLLLLKVAAVLVILALAAAGRAWVRRHYLDGRRTAPDPHQMYFFRRRITHEALLALGVLGLSAALVNAQPAHTAFAGAGAGPPVAVSQTGTAPANRGTLPFDAGGGPSGKGQLAFDILPRHVGLPAGVHVTVLDTDSRPRAVPEVTVELWLPANDLGPLPVPVQGAGTGHFMGTVTVPMAGRWEAAVKIRVSDADQVVLRVPIEVG